MIYWVMLMARETASPDTLLFTMDERVILKNEYTYFVENKDMHAHVDDLCPDGFAFDQWYCPFRSVIRQIEIRLHSSVFQLNICLLLILIYLGDGTLMDDRNARPTITHLQTGCSKTSPGIVI